MDEFNFTFKLGDNAPAGSGDVCNVDGSTCPQNKCCRDTKCETDAPELKCCDDPTIEPDKSNPECSNCPKCGKHWNHVIFVGLYTNINPFISPHSNTN